MHAITVFLFFIPMSVLGIAWRGLVLKLPKPCATCRDHRNIDSHGFLVLLDSQPSRHDASPRSIALCCKLECSEV